MAGIIFCLEQALCNDQLRHSSYGLTAHRTGIGHIEKLYLEQGCKTESAGWYSVALWNQALGSPVAVVIMQLELNVQKRTLSFGRNG